jgi:hypothetical protein
MSHPQSVRARFGLVIACGLVALTAIVFLVFVSTAHAAEEPKGYGELARFGEMGDGPGQLDELRTRAIGVDPTNNSVYVVDEPKPPTELPSEVKPEKLEHHIRLQKFTLSKETGKYAVNASAEFTETTPFFEALGFEEGVSTMPMIQGIAVDPTHKRVFLLLVDMREKALTQDKETGEPGSFMTAASTLYAFSTEDSGGKLSGAGNEGANKEILTGPGPGGLEPQSPTPGSSLLQPHGITVDPESGEAMILAHVDPHKRKADEISTFDHFVVQKIRSNGTLGERWVDSKDILKTAPKGISFTPAPHSPVIVQAGGKEHLEIGYAGVAEIPLDFKSEPKQLSVAPQEGIAQGPTAGDRAAGGRLAAAPDGTVWGATGSVFNEAAGGLEPRGGVMAFSGADGSEIGYTGGQAPVEPAKTLDKCVVEPNVFGTFGWLVPRIAAGSEGKMFALAPEFLLRAEPEGTEGPAGETLREPLPGPFFPTIVEFGPGGTGCPEASATPPAAKFAGSEVLEARPGSVLTLTSQVKQADALKVEWEFSDGTKVVTSTDQYQTTKVEHKFDKEEEATIKEKIYSDDLAAANLGQGVYQAGHLVTPMILVERKLPIRRPPPKVAFSGPEAVPVGAVATFESESSDPNEKALPLEYVWEFGDGTPATERTKTSTASHTYGSPGTYTVTLTVYDQIGLKASASHSITVIGGGGSPPPAPPPSPPPPPPPPPLPPGGGSRGVLSYQASLAGTSLSVSPAGAVVITVRCLGQSSCSGNVTLQTLNAVSARLFASARKQLLTLGGASFSLSGGQTRKVTVHLSAKARKLLARIRVLRARATIVAHDSQGVLHTTKTTVTLRAARGKRH